MPRQSVDRQQAIIAAVSERLNSLSAKQFHDLAALPRGSSEDLVIAGKKITLSVWHDALPSGEHLIAVQAYKPESLLHMGWMCVDGFVIDAQNQRRPLTQEEKAPFS